MNHLPVRKCFHMKTHPKQAKSPGFAVKQKPVFRCRGNIATSTKTSKQNLDASHPDAAAYSGGERRSQDSSTGATADPDTTFRQKAQSLFSYENISGLLTKMYQIRAVIEHNM